MTLANAVMEVYRMNSNKRHKKKKYDHKLISFIIFSGCLIVVLFRNDLFLGNDQSVTPVSQTTNMSKDWALTLVNKWNEIPKDYKVSLVTLDNGEKIDERISSALQEMFNDARKSGYYPTVVSGYRTAKDQSRILKDKIQEYQEQGYSKEEANDLARAWVANPGTSEHQMGISVDINPDPKQSVDNELYTWLADNAHKYGFINRYPSDKTEITGVINEPWHYRYVGVEDATKMHENGLCLEEYIDKNIRIEGK